MNFTNEALAVRHFEPTQLWEQLVRNCRRCFEKTLHSTFDECMNNQVLIVRALFDVGHGKHKQKISDVDMIDVLQEIQSDLCPLLDAKRLNLSIDGQCREAMSMNRDRCRLALFTIVLEAVSLSQSSSDIDVSVDQYAKYLEVEIADTSDRRISNDVLPATVWSIRCAAFLLADLPINYEVTNCPQGGIATRIKVDTYAARKAA